jgi:hypothetical protein
MQRGQKTQDRLNAIEAGDVEWHDGGERVGSRRVKA